MMYRLFKLILAISSTSLLPVIFLIKSRYYLFEFDFYRFITNENLIKVLIKISLLGYFLLPFFSMLLVIHLLKHLDKDDIKDGEVKELEDVTNTFLPSFLGYFFVALSIQDNDFFSLGVIYLIILTFVYISQTNYFNPLFLILGYKFYKVKTKGGLSLLLISKLDYKKASDVSAKKVYRINNFTFINR